MNDRRGQDRQPGVERRVAEHVLEELLADEHRAHQRAEDDDPGHGRDPERPAARRCARSYSGAVARRWRITKAAPAATAIAASPRASGSLSGTGAKLIASTSAATSTTERMPPRLSTGSRGLVDVRGHEAQRHHQSDDGERQGDQEDRPPVRTRQQRAGDQRAERGDRPADARPERDRLRPRRDRTTAP